LEAAFFAYLFWLLKKGMVAEGRNKSNILLNITVKNEEQTHPFLAVVKYGSHHGL
jgi:hypothetical protein